jgi:glutaminase
MAAGGVNPLTGVRALDDRSVESVLSVMGSCGMYDFAGEWTCSVGLPAKSGVSGGILAVLPGQLGIGIFSPALDDRGNSARGIAVCRELSQDLGLHLFAAPRAGREVIHRSYSAAEVSSNRERRPDIRKTLSRVGRAARVYELQGILAFGTAEIVVRDVTEHAAAEVEIAVLDLSRVAHLNATAAGLLSLLAQSLAEQGKRLLFAHRKPEFTGLIRACLRKKSPSPEVQNVLDGLDALTFPDVDRALEWCENALLAASAPLRFAPDGKEDRIAAEPLEDFALLRGLAPAEFAIARGLLRCVHYRAGDRIVRTGDPADCLFLVALGEVTAMLPLLSGHEKRLATFTAGMSFGEMAFVEGSTRSATIYADRDTECWILDRQDLDRLASTHPRVKAVLMENIALDLCQRLRATNGTLSALAQ